MSSPDAEPTDRADPVRQLLPEAAETTIAEAYASPLGQYDDRPWIGLCMVTSIDGSTVVDGRSKGLSSDNDVAVLSALRSIADVIIVGAGTVRGEGYGPPRAPGQRVGVVTGSGDIDTTTPLFESGAGFVITTTAAVIPRDDSVDVIRSGDADIDLGQAIAQLTSVHRTPRFVQVEGGAHLNGAMLDADVFDEIDITTSPLCVGGDGPRLATGADDHEHRYELSQLIVDDQAFMFTRWLRKR